MSLKGHLLVSHPKMMDPNFHNTVVLITEESKEGAIGLVLNRAGPVTVKDLWKNTFKEDVEVKGWVHSGGPVYNHPTYGPVISIHNSESFSEVEIMDRSDDDFGVYLTHSKRMLKALLVFDMKDRTNTFPDFEYRMFLGYASWQPGQLEKELDAGAWFLAEAGAKDVFYTYGEDLYKKCLDTVSVEIMNAIIPELTKEHFKNAPNN